MQRSTQPTDYILITARTNSEWDDCEFAIIHLPDEYRSILQERAATAERFNEDPSFYHLTY